MNIERTLKANLAASHMAKAFFMAIIDANGMPAQTWEHLPVQLRCSLIECCGRMILHLGPVNTHEAMTAAVFELCNAIAHSSEQQNPFLVKRQPTTLLRVPEGI